MDNFLKDFQKTMSDTFGDDIVMKDGDDAPATVEKTPVQIPRPISPVVNVPGAFTPASNAATAGEPRIPDTVTHRGVVCDHCNGPVKGTRFKVCLYAAVDGVTPVVDEVSFQCLTCVDFDLCEKCMGENDHGKVLHSAQYDDEHKFEAITAPQRRRRFLEAVAAARSRRQQLYAGDKPVHNAYCDVCGKTIIGSRHKCVDCKGTLSMSPRSRSGRANNFFFG